MSRNSEGYTPKTLAYDIAIGWVKAAATGKTNDVDLRSHTNTFEKKTKQQLAKLHNRLLRESGLDGVELDEDQVD